MSDIEFEDYSDEEEETKTVDESSDSEEEENDDESKEDEFVEEEGGADGIDPNEIYEEYGVKQKKLTFRKKRGNNPKTAKNIKRGEECSNGLFFNYGEDFRKDSVSILSRFTTEKNSSIVEKSIYNFTIRKLETIVCRSLKPTDTTSEQFKNIYTDTLYETCVELKKVKCSDQLANVKSDKVGLRSKYFDDERHVDLQETNNIENPPRPKPGIHRCNKCFFNKTLKDDTERGKRTWYYELQTRSSDEPMTQFVTCLDCGFKWKQ